MRDTGGYLPRSVCLNPYFWVSKGLLFVAVFLFTLGGTAQAGNPDRKADDLLLQPEIPSARLLPRDGIIRLPAARGVPSVDKRLDIPARGTFTLESGSVSFGEVSAGTEQELPGAVRIRVFSDRDWIVKLVPAALLVSERGEAAPLSRLSWRSAGSGGFLPFQEGRPIPVARGSRTGGAGRMVLVDLRLRLGNADALGRFGCEFRVVLEEM